MNEILTRASELNQLAEGMYFTLAVTLSEIEEQEAYKELGYESYADYVEGELNRSKGTASKMLKVGKFLRSSGFLPETINTTYPRLYASINLLPDAPAEKVLEHAVALRETDLITAKNAQDAGEHECKGKCIYCKRLM